MADVMFAQRLASNEKPIRDRTLKRLRKYIAARSSMKGTQFICQFCACMFLFSAEWLLVYCYSPYSLLLGSNKSMTCMIPLPKNGSSNLGISGTTELKIVNMKFEWVFFHASLSLDLKQFTLFDSTSDKGKLFKSFAV